jgi:hypothetical protein
VSDKKEARELLQIALSHLEGRPEYSNKQVVIQYIRAYLKHTNLKTGD